VEQAREEYEVSERRACRVVRQWRGTQRYQPLRRTDEDQLTQAILALGVKYGRYGYRRITVLLQNAGWPVGKDRVQRIWRREGLKLAQIRRPFRTCSVGQTPQSCSKSMRTLEWIPVARHRTRWSKQWG
jgi:putative transposase